MELEFHRVRPQTPVHSPEDSPGALVGRSVAWNGVTLLSGQKIV